MDIGSTLIVDIHFELPMGIRSLSSDLICPHQCIVSVFPGLEPEQTGAAVR